MRKISLLFLTLMLAFASSMYAQDKVYVDFDRSTWTADAPDYSPIDNAVGGDIADAKYLLDGDTKTFLALVKPNLKHEGVNGPGTIEELGFTIDMQEAKVFDYFRIQFRTSNQQWYLRPWEVSIYGSNDPDAAFDAGTWTLIKDDTENKNEKIVLLEGGENQTGDPYSVQIDLDNSTPYRSIKVVYTRMSTSLSGKTLQVAGFYVGKTTTDRVIKKSDDISFGDIPVGVSSQKTLGIAGYNLVSSQLSYTLEGDGKDAFSVQQQPGGTSLGDTAVITFTPAARKLYTAKLIIDMTDVVEPDTVILTGNADFDLPVQISSGTDHWYYLQFVRQGAAGMVLTKPAAAGAMVEQTLLAPGTDSQQWKVTGTWDNYKVINKLGQELTFAHIPASEDPGTGNITDARDNYITSATGDSFGFIRYKTTESWQLNNLTSEDLPKNKTFLWDDAGTHAGTGALNNAGSQLRFIDASVPALVVPGDTVMLGAVRKNTSGDFTVTVAGISLTGNITVALTDDADQVYTLKTTSVPAVGGPVEITFAPVAYKKISYATITLTNGSLTESFVVGATSDVGISKYYLYAGETNPWGDREDGEIVTEIPTLKAEDEMWIAAGEYTVPQITVPEKAAIYGGFSGTETSVDQRAVGSKPWEFTNAATLKNRSELVLSISGNAIIDGITFEGAAKGRAIQITTSTAAGTIIRNSIMKNFDSVDKDGGAMNIRIKTEIYNCLITGNSAIKGGGGYLDNVTIHDCEITNNSVPLTASNSVGSEEGGGGGLLLVNSEAYNLYVEGNKASFGGGLFPRTGTKVYNSIIVKNTAKTGSGISFDERDSGVTVYNVTVAENLATLEGGAGVNFAANGEGRVHKLYNSILWNNKDDAQDMVYNIGISGSAVATPEIKNVIIDDLEFYAIDINENLVITDGIAETDRAKLFEEGSWVTAETCPGINKGFTLLTEEVIDPETGEVAAPATRLEFATGKDYAGNLRVLDKIDIGPYESQKPTSVVNPESDADGNVISTKYYNIQGLEVLVPIVNNVYIKKELLDTGKVRATKVLFTGNYVNQ